VIGMPVQGQVGGARMIPLNDPTGGEPEYSVIRVVMGPPPDISED
jgi:hypothetical protein